MTFGCYNKMNMFGMGNMFGLGNMFGGTNVIGQLFSGTNSIFGNGYNMYSNYGSGGCGLFMDCKGNYNYDAMAGFAVGGTLLNVAGAAIGQAIENKKENSVENLGTQVKDAEKNIKTKEQNLETKKDELDTLNGKTEDLTNTSKEAKANYDRVNNYLNTKKAAYDAAIQKRDVRNEPLSKEDENIIKLYENYQKERPSFKTEKESADEKLKNHLKAIEKKKEEVTKAEEELKTAKDELEEAKKALETAKLDNADGNKLNRISDKKYNAKFKTNENGEATSDFEGTPEFSKKDLRKALYLYNVASDNKKDTYKQQFIKIYEHLQNTNNSEELKGMKEAYELIKKK